VTLGGQHFVGVGSVRMIGGANDLPVEILAASPSSVRVRVPQAAAGQYSFRVAAQGGTSANSAQRFTVVLEAPAIHELSSQSGMPGTEFTVKGVHFQPLVAVSLTGDGGDHGAEVLAQTSTEVRVRIPAAPAGSYGIRLVAAGGVSPESRLRFQIVQEPVIRSLEPASGSIATRVRVAGENLESMRAVYLVGEGMETRATLLGTTPGELECQISADTPPGTYALRLESPFGHIQPADLAFRVEAPGGGAPASGPDPLAERAAAERAVTARNAANQASAEAAAAEQAAAAQAARAVAERAAAERLAEAQAAMDRAAAERAERARVEAERAAANQAARAEAERVAAEQAAQAEAERAAANQAALAEAERVAAEQAARAEAERTATNQAERTAAARALAERAAAARQQAEAAATRAGLSQAEVARLGAQAEARARGGSELEIRAAGSHAVREVRLARGNPDGAAIGSIEAADRLERNLQADAAVPVSAS